MIEQWRVTCLGQVGACAYHTSTNELKPIHHPMKLCLVQQLCSKFDTGTWLAVSHDGCRQSMVEMRWPYKKWILCNMQIIATTQSMLTFLPSLSFFLIWQAEPQKAKIKSLISLLGYSYIEEPIHNSDLLNVFMYWHCHTKNLIFFQIFLIINAECHFFDMLLWSESLHDQNSF